MFWFKKRNFNKDDVKLLKEIRQVLKWIGLGDVYGLCGNNQAHLRDLLCDDPHCYEVVDGKPRECTLNEHDKECVLRLRDNNNECLRYKESDVYNRLCELIRKLDG